MIDGIDLSRIVQQIQYVLAPAVMISSAALFLLGMQNRFISLTSRFRALTHEKRLLSQKGGLSTIESARFENISNQIKWLIKRITQMKIAIQLAYWAIICFISTSILLFLKIYTGLETIRLIILFFLSGLLLILIDCVLMISEIGIAFKIIKLETKSS